MTPTQRAAAERLADELADAPMGGTECWQAAALLCELLAEPQGEPVLEPVAYIHAWKSSAGHIGRTLHWQATSPHGDDVEVFPLYTHPPQQRKPLTREQIDAVWSSLGSFTDRESDYRIFARAIERAHGITGEPT